MQPAHNPNSAWASGSSRPNPSVPRSTSVEYEREAQATIARRLPAPPSRHAPPRSTPGRRPLTKTTSARHVSDSEGEAERPAANGRGKSPFEEVYDSAKRVLAPVSFYLQQKLQVPGEISMEGPSTATANGKESSYDYTVEEQEFQASRNAKNQAHKRGKMSVDNKAYKPPVSDPESSEDDSGGDDKTKKRRKKKKKDSTGLFNQLPVITHDKRRKKKSRGSKQNIEEEDDESGSEENTDRVRYFLYHISNDSKATYQPSNPHNSALQYRGILYLHYHDIQFLEGLYPQNTNITNPTPRWTLSRASILYLKPMKMTFLRIPPTHLTSNITNKSNDNDPFPDLLHLHHTSVALSAAWCILSLEHSSSLYIPSSKSLSPPCTPWDESLALSLVLFGYDRLNGHPVPVQVLNFYSHLRNTPQSQPSF